MPSAPYDIPLDLELIRVGHHMDETHAIARYRLLESLTGRKEDCFCLVPDAQDVTRTDVFPAIEDTLRLLCGHYGPAEVHTDELYDITGVLVAADGKFLLDSDIASVEKIPTCELNASSPLSEQQRRNVQMAFDNLEPYQCLHAARLFASRSSRSLDSWSAFEVCTAIMDNLLENLIAPLAEEGRDHRQVRELHRIAEYIHEAERDDLGPLNRLYGEIAAHRELDYQSLWSLRRALKVVGAAFDPAWLGLDRQQLDEATQALTQGVPAGIVRIYATGRFQPAAMRCLTLAYLDDELRGSDFARLANPAFGTEQLWEVEAACAAHRRCELPTAALDLICDPALPQPVMNALWLGFTHYGLSVEAVRDLLSPDATAEQVWDLIESKDAPEEAIEAEPTAAGDAPETPQRGSLSDMYRSQREASGQLSADEVHETQEPEHEEME